MFYAPAFRYFISFFVGVCDIFSQKDKGDDNKAADTPTAGQYVRHFLSITIINTIRLFVWRGPLAARPIICR